MILARAPGDAVRSSPMSTVAPIVFIVDDDVSVRESLELLIQNEGWRAEAFPSAEDFLDHPRTALPSCLILDVLFRASTVWSCSSEWPPSVPTCRSSLSRATVISP